MTIVSHLFSEVRFIFASCSISQQASSVKQRIPKILINYQEPVEPMDKVPSTSFERATCLRVSLFFIQSNLAFQTAVSFHFSSLQQWLADSTLAMLLKILLMCLLNDTE